MRRDKYYVLQGTKAVPVKSIMQWATMFENTDGRRVAFDSFEGVEVSTVFLGINHNWGEGDPLLFETMVFTDIEGGGEMERYFIWEEAVEGHNRIVAKMRAKLAASKAKGVAALDAVMNKSTEEQKGE